MDDEEKEKHCTAVSSLLGVMSTSRVTRGIRILSLPASTLNRSAPSGCSASSSILSVPSCHAIRRKREGWDTTRLPKPRQGKSRGRCRIRTTDLPVIKFAL
ncbi:hypothetical protein T265_00406 [Opisthorchis viverrini]|uniref:Uncharacterized protein n=1 Tax=Opisthorchis viverrini TaxID=6198 RepID=A0A075A1Z3_OPIVI|nr:hypothetical protein T265_00406 [Opisthorchis viverrini]KER33718.1 hypothetical protein T265_00406 [Opisthorchis viverrini]